MSRLKLRSHSIPGPGSSMHPSLVHPSTAWRRALLAASIIFALALFLLPVQSMAQEFRGTISGSVTDPTGAAIPGAKVTITETSSGTTSTTITNGKGQYTVPFLLPGKYTVAVRKEGFKRNVRNGLYLNTSEHLVIDLKMQLGRPTQTVTVTAAAPLLNTSDASVGQTITTQEVADLPLDGRTPLMLAQLAMGVLPTGHPSLVHPFDNNGAAAWSIGGSPSQSSEILMDGSPDELWNGSVAFNPPEDTVKQVSVKAFDTNAAYGHTSAGVINQVLKSGGNKFHGTLYEFAHISSLNANSYFNDQAGKPKTVSHYNQYGLEVSGPVWIPHVFNGHNKLFFLFAWEGLRDSAPNTDFTTVPTAAERKGDFGGICTQGFDANGVCNNTNYQLYNPFSATKNSSGHVVRQPIPYNNFANAGISIDPVAKAFLQYYPQPNTVGSNVGQYNYISSVPSTDHFNNYLGRLDLNVGAATHIFFDFRHNLRTQSKRNYFNNAATGETLNRSNWGSTFDAVHTFNASTVLDVRLNWTYFHQQEGEPGDGISPTTLGLPPELAKNSEHLQLPYVDFGSCGSQKHFQCLGGDHFSSYPSNSYQVFAELMKTIGNHNLSFGFDGRSYRLGAAAYKYASGRFKFRSDWTRAASNLPTPKFGGEFADFLMGLPHGGEFDDKATNSFYNYYFAGFVQDNWRVSSNFTLNAGLRYSHNGPWYDKHGAVVDGFDTTARSPIAGAAEAAYSSDYAAGDYMGTPLPAPSSFNVLGGLTFPSSHDGAYYHQNANWFSPRFGFAWTPAFLHNKTVVRGGFGVFVSPFTIARLDPNGKWSSDPILDNEGFSAKTDLVATKDDYLTPYATLSNPFPDGIEQPTGSSAGLGTFMGQSVSFIDSHPSDPYSMRWNLGFQQSVSRNIMFEMDYVGNHAVHMPVYQRQLNYTPRQYLNTTNSRNQTIINQLSKSVTNPFHHLLSHTHLNGSTTSVSQLLTRFPEFPRGGVTENNATTGQSFFNAFEVRIEHRSAHGLWLVANYSWSKLLTQDVYLNPSDPQPNLHTSPFDFTNHFNLGATYNLPIGRGKAIDIHNRWLDELVGGWVINGMYTAQTGPPVYWNYDMVTTGKPIKFNSRETAHGVSAISKDSFDLQNSDQFAYHIRTFPLTISDIRSNGINNLESSVLKKFRLVGRASFELRFETFNTFNHPMFAAPDVDPTSTSFGEIKKQANDPRKIQIGGKIVF